MSSDSHLTEIAQTTLHKISGLDALASFGLPDRLIRAYWDRHYGTLLIASDGLDLSQKILIEESFNQLAPLEEDQEWHLFFQKTSLDSQKEKRIPFSPPKSPKKTIPGVTHIIPVASGKGGVGKSTVTVHLALALKDLGYRVGIFDGDLYGPSIPALLGLEKTHLTLGPGNKLIPPRGARDIPCVSFGFFTDGKNPLLWRGPLISQSLERFTRETAWGELDVLLVDCPPGTGDIPLTLCQDYALKGALIVSTPQKIALLDAQKAIALFRKEGVPILGLVENMTTYICPTCCSEDDIFGGEAMGVFAQENGVPILAQIPLQKNLRLVCDEGAPTNTRHWIQLAKNLTAELSLKTLH
jgi:ATP-binding protein involved in chromosome partitioning